MDVKKEMDYELVGYYIDVCNVRTKYGSFAGKTKQKEHEPL